MILAAPSGKELRISPAGGDKVSVPAVFNDPPGVHHDDAVGHYRLVQPVGNHEGGAPPGDKFGGRLQGVGLVGSGFRGGLVEDENVGVAEQHPGEGDLLLHFRHERYRARPHLGVEAEGEGPAEGGAVLGQAHGSKGVEKLPVGGGGGPPYGDHRAACRRICAPPG